MKMAKVVLLVIATFTLSACGGSSSGGKISDDLPPLKYSKEQSWLLLDLAFNEAELSQDQVRKRLLVGFPARDELSPTILNLITDENGESNEGGMNISDINIRLIRDRYLSRDLPEDQFDVLEELIVTIGDDHEARQTAITGIKVDGVKLSKGTKDAIITLSEIQKLQRFLEIYGITTIMNIDGVDKDVNLFLLQSYYDTSALQTPVALHAIGTLMSLFPLPIVE